MSEQPAEFSMPTPGSFQDPERSGLSADDLFAGITEHLFFTLGKLAPSATRHDLYMALSYAVRDRLMTRLARRYPHYGWHSNAGYGSALHRDAMASVGVTAHHRQSFAPLRNWLEDPEKAHNVVRAMNA